MGLAVNCPQCGADLNGLVVYHAHHKGGKPPKRVTYANVTGTVREICAALNINRYQLARRIAKQQQAEKLLAKAVK